MSVEAPTDDGASKMQESAHLRQSVVSLVSSERDAADVMYVAVQDFESTANQLCDDRQS